MLLDLRMPVLGVSAAGIRRCPDCQGTTHGHGRNKHRQVIDTRLNEVEQRRFRCVRCCKTLQTRPQGLLGGAQRSDRLKAFGVILYVLGLSYGKVATVMRGLVGMGSASTVYRDVQRTGRKASELRRTVSGKVRVLGIDGTGQKMKGWNEGVVFAVDQEGQLLVRVEVMEEANEREIKRFLKELCREYGVKVVVSDEHRSYSYGVKGLDVEHRLCEAHWKRSKVRRAKGLAERARKRRWERQALDLEELERLVKEWPEAEEAEVRDLWEEYVKYRAPSPGKRWSFGYEIRLLMQDVLESWGRVGPTNNSTERLIGLLLKIRSSLMRGFQKPENIKKFVYLNGYLWANRKACDLTPLFN